MENACVLEQIVKEKDESEIEMVQIKEEEMDFEDDEVPQNNPSQIDHKNAIAVRC